MKASAKNLSQSFLNIFNEIADRNQYLFVERERNLDGPNFLKAIVFSFLQYDHPTLSQIVQITKELGLEISEQAISKRFNEKAFKFFEKVLAESGQIFLKSRIKVDLGFLNKFKGVEICDTSVIDLPDCFHNLFPGLGNKANLKKSSIKLDTSIEILNGDLKIHITNGIMADNKTPSAIKLGRSGSLQLRDLGYFDLSRLLEQHNEGVYYISKFKSGVKLFNKNGNEISMLELVKNKNRSNYEFNAFAGNAERVPVRVILNKLDKKKSQKKKKKKKRKSKKNNSKQSKLSKLLGEWSVLITNVSKENLTGKECYNAYRMRWQIELIFKTWKDYCKVDESNSKNPWRILCEVYAKLIGVLIQHWVTLNGQWERKDKSYKKGYQVVRRKSNQLLEKINAGILKNLVEFLEDLKKIFGRGCSQNVRKKHPNAYRNLAGYERRAS